MDPISIGSLIGGGSLITAMASFAVNAWFRQRENEKKSDDELVQKALQAMKVICAENMAECVEHQNQREARLHHRCDDIIEKTHMQVVELNSDIGEIKGTLKNIAAAMNGGLELRLSRAVRMALSEDKQ